MAIPIKSVPTLRGLVAERFNQIATQNATSKRATVDFTEQVRIARAILERAKINK